MWLYIFYFYCILLLLSFVRNLLILDLLLPVNKDSACRCILMINILLFLFTIIFKNNYIHTYVYVNSCTLTLHWFFSRAFELRLNYFTMNSERNEQCRIVFETFHIPRIPAYDPCVFYHKIGCSIDRLKIQNI